jgi:hypothetical protein
MEKRDDTSSREKLIKRLPSPGWNLEAGKSPPLANRTLEEVVRAAHAQHAAGETAGIIRHVETKLELDLIQLQELWMHLGLPM